MTTQPPTPTDPQLPLTPPPGQPPVAPTPPPAGRNVIGTIALVAAIIGVVFACIPGALIVGWVLLPTAFVLGIVSLFQKTSKKAGTWAIILSVVGTIIATIVFLVVVSNAVDDAFGGTDSTISTPDDATAADPDGDAAPDETDGDTDAEPPADLGTRENPAPLGTVVTGEDWEVTITSFDPAATDAVLAANQFNEPPAEGMTYAVVGVSATYLGEDSSMALFVGIDYVTASGEVLTSADAVAVAPDPQFGTAELFTGGTDAGNKVLQIPADGGGVLRVTPGMIADPVFIATS